MPDYMEMSMHRLDLDASIYYSQMVVHLTDIDRNLLDTPGIYHVDQGLKKTEYTMKQVVASLMTPLGTIPKEYGDGECITFYQYVWSQLVDDNAYDVCLNLASRRGVATDFLSGGALTQALGTLLNLGRCGWEAINLYLVRSQMSGKDITQVVHIAMQHSTEYIFILRTIGGRECIISPLLVGVPKRHAFWVMNFSRLRGAEVVKRELWYQFNGFTNCTMQYTALEETHKHEGINNESSTSQSIRDVRIL